MSTADATDTPPAQRPDDGSEIDDLEFLKRGLLLGDGFQLYVGTAPSVDAREAVIRDLQATEGLRVSTVRGEERDAPIEGAIARAFDSMKDGPERPVVVVTDIERDADGAASLLRRLNERRNELIARVPAAVVILGGAHTVGVLRRVAPDAWSVRAGDVDLGSVDVPRVREDQSEQALQPIHPPSSDAERRDLERLVWSLPEGDARGRAAMRLAEVLEFEGVDRRREAALFLQAAKETADPWSSTLARINAGRAFLWGGDDAAARDTLSEALNSEAMRDPSLQSYASLSMAMALRHAGEVQTAMARVRLALATSSDKDMVVEARLEAARIFEEVGDFHAALGEIEAAELVAMELRDPRLLQRVHLLMGRVAARNGRQALVLNALRKVARRDDRKALWSVLRLIWGLDRAGETHAARIAWSALREIAEEQKITTELYRLAVEQLWHTLVEHPEIHDVASWKARLGEGLPADAADLTRAWFDVIDGRSALNAGDIPAAIAALGRLFEAKHVPEPIRASPPATATWLGALLLSHRDEEALATLRKALGGPERTPLLSYLAATASLARKPADLPVAEGAVVLAAFRLMVDDQSRLVDAPATPVT